MASGTRTKGPAGCRILAIALRIIYAAIGTWKYWQFRAEAQAGYDLYSERVVTDVVASGATESNHVLQRAITSLFPPAYE